MTVIGRLDALVQRRCEICGCLLLVQPKISKTKENTDLEIRVNTGCGKCGDNKEAIARSGFLSVKIGEISENQLNKLRIKGMIQE